MIRLSEMFKNTVFAILTGLFLASPSYAQNQQEKRTASIQLSFYKKSDLNKVIIASVKGKNLAGKFFPVKGTKLNFYTLEGKENVLMTDAVTDFMGKALVVLSNNIPKDENLNSTIICKLENDSVYADAEEEVHFKDANLVLTLSPQDTTRTLTARVTEFNKDGKIVPVKGLDVKFYIKRLFGIMAASEDYTVTTDDNGEAGFSYPGDVKGDLSGNVTLVARIDDNETYGNIESWAIASWGIPLVVEKNPFPRALWEPHAPYPLIITVAILYGGVWCTYFFVFYQMRKIKKQSKPTV